MSSLRSRQFLSALAIIFLGILLLGSVLYYVTQHKMLKDEESSLSESGLELMGFMDFNDGKFVIDNSSKNDFLAFLTKNNFSKLSSEKFAYIQHTETGNIVWHSQYPFNDISAGRFAKDKRKVFTTFLLNMPAEVEGVDILNPEDTQGRNVSKLDGAENYIVYARGFNYKPNGAYQLILAKSAETLQKGHDEIIRNILLLFLITTILVLISQLVSSYLVITPIRKFEQEINKIESGEQQLISKEYPTELSAVKSAVNALINAEKGQKQRYRDALDDLAHSLKTPLSVLQSSAEKSHNDIIRTQVERMDDIIAYQLRRAVVNEHGGTIIKQQAVRPVLYRLKDSLIKVYRDKPFEFVINVDDVSKCRMEEDDMMEVFGNLANNACRFCEKIVEITGTQNGDTLIIDIDDDGLGFPDKNPSELLQRGIRADSQSEGQGIGLAVSTEIVEAIGGKIELLISPYVGARVRLHLPM
ncbi:ATP-binding protein [uncultured Cocleimonas sp.]|uniref:ATP-binding protein n=1 Tax=uncultured Cocleimonas sp. TaxID=1051587 RepID=UPI0026061093|nr:ATP-binding protein [uncultured Cocleimonas sp.]